MNKIQINNKPSLKEERKYLRNNPTPEEKLLWQYLRMSQLRYKFRRQHSIENYILDFYCPQKRLAIEVDGAHHFTKESKEQDRVRDLFLNNLQIRVLRFSNSQITNNITEVLNTIEMHLNKTTPWSPPALGGETGEVK